MANYTSRFGFGPATSRLRKPRRRSFTAASRDNFTGKTRLFAYLADIRQIVAMLFTH
jgi:hypothetical protein